MANRSKIDAYQYLQKCEKNYHKICCRKKLKVNLGQVVNTKFLIIPYQHDERKNKIEIVTVHVNYFLEHRRTGLCEPLI